MGDKKKLCSEEVPRAFTEWLLAMGYPAESEPLMDKVAEMCRGNGRLVWRSLMEKVEAMKVIRDKRMQVFCDDIRRYEKQKLLNEFDTNNPAPEPLLLWSQQTKLRGEVAEAEERVLHAKQNLSYVKDKISAKLTERNLSHRRVEDVQRRAWFLQQMAEDLRARKAKLEETRAIAQSLNPVSDDRDIQNKLDRCISSLRCHGPQSSASMSSSVSQLSMMSAISSSTAIEDNNFEEQLSSLVKCSGAALCSALYKRRAALIAALPITAVEKADQSRSRVTAQSVLATTEALHCSLALEAIRNRILLKQAKNRLLAAASKVNKHLTGESCELFVVQCEKACVEARVNALRTLLDELVTRRGAFEVCEEQADHYAVSRPIAVVDKAIKSKIEELKKVNTSLIITEREIQNLRECLTTVFNGFHKDLDLTPNDNNSYNGLKLDMPQESIATLREFCEARRKRRANKMELSMDSDISGRSEFDAIDITNPRFIDELHIYLKKFNLEKNRKLVLESGEKIWIFESTLDRLYSSWPSEYRIYASVSPRDSLSSNLQRIVLDVRTKRTLEAMKRAFRPVGRPQDIDITPQIEEEEKLIDKIKKHLKDNLILLQKINTSLDPNVDNLKFWADNKLRNHISHRITVRGLTYKQYEMFYLENYDSSK